MEYVLNGLAYIGIGHLLSALFLRKDKEPTSFYYFLLWWTLWPPAKWKRPAQAPAQPVRAQARGGSELR